MVTEQIYDYSKASVDMETGMLLEYGKLLKHQKFAKNWSISAANEFGQLAQGIGGKVTGINTIYFIHKSEVPPDQFTGVTCIRFVCNVCTDKKEPNRTKVMIGGDRINYPDNVSMPTPNLLLITADLLTVKLLLNSVISTPGA